MVSKTKLLVLKPYFVGGGGNWKGLFWKTHVLSHKSAFISFKKIRTCYIPNIMYIL